MCIRDRINITPFVDVLLVLLISFLISAPLLTQAIQIHLPRGKLNERVPVYKESILAVVNKKKQIVISDQIYSLKSLAKSLTKNDNEWKRHQPVYVQMDERVPYGILMDLILLFKKAGFPQVGLVFKKDSQ